ncbi:hypothetical protein PoB_001440600 [Plakobranchus ocellatus]|uniref:Uncharacterized protein n=1 Tax=Plakobranchus ocellatus TaxID=259542 RepID=A0AAV3YWP0_9GAST|nr:hypothetical protein PoB_001440600 [Plakobranchus ocellatus]
MLMTWQGKSGGDFNAANNYKLTQHSELQKQKNKIIFRKMKRDSKLSLLFFPCISSQRLSHILSLELKVLCLCSSQSVLPTVQLPVCATSSAAPSVCYQQCSSQSVLPAVQLPVCATSSAVPSLSHQICATSGAAPSLCYQQCSS